MEEKYRKEDYEEFEWELRNCSLKYEKKLAKSLKPGTVRRYMRIVWCGIEYIVVERNINRYEDIELSMISSKLYRYYAREEGDTWVDVKLVERIMTEFLRFANRRVKKKAD